MDRSEIIERARSLIDAKFIPRGRSVHGLDCIFLLLFCGDMQGGRHDRIDYTPQHLVDGELREALVAAGLEPLEVDDADPGDVISFRWWGKPGRIERHVGVLVDGGNIVQVSDEVGKVQEVPLKASLRRLAVSAYRYPGVSPWP